jgi:Alpha/beta hydrolase domain
MIVRRPQDPARFSGTVVVEWLNTTTGRDLDASWGGVADEIIREGHAWVGVSAQQPGIRTIVAADPQRYGSLDLPGSPFSLDVFTQAGRALTRHSGAAPLAGLEPEHLIAIGQSQSASYLISYLNGVQPLVEVFDGFLLHTPAQAGRVRADLEQPALVFLSESELAGFGYASVRQRDSRSVRTWEVAGTAHADGAILKQSGYASACPSVNEGPHRQTLRAALHHLVSWAATGEAPPKAPRVELVTETGKRRRVVIARDEYGNAAGGIRTPLVDVPVYTLSGEPAPDSPPLCRLFGSTTPFDAATLARLYPTHDAYVSAFTASTEAAVDAGFILRPEADEMIATAEQSAIGTGVA